MLFKNFDVQGGADRCERARSERSAEEQKTREVVRSERREKRYPTMPYPPPSLCGRLSQKYCTEPYSNPSAVRSSLSLSRRRTLIYLTLYLQSCMTACDKVADKKEAKTVLYQHAIKSFVCPGDTGWGLGGMFPSATNREESDAFKAYFKQARTELSERVLETFYAADGSQNKWWMCFSKRKFMGKELRT